MKNTSPTPNVQPSMLRSAWPGFRPLLLLVTVLAIVSIQPARAAGDSWNVDADGNWITPGNWLGGNIPGSVSTDNSDIATFSFALTAGRAVTVDADRYIGGISFGNTSTFGYTLQTGILHLNNAGVIQTLAANGAHTDTISSAITIDGGSGSKATFTANAASASSVLSIGGGITGTAAAGGNTTLTLNGTNTGANTVAGIIGNGANGGILSIVKSGAGTWSLSGANTYNGTTAINGGVLQISAANNLGDSTQATNTISINAGKLQSTANSYDLGSNRAITLNGAATIQSDAGTLTVSGNVTNGGNLLTVTGAGNTAISGRIGSGAGGVTKSGAGTLTLTGANTYTGTTTVSAGTLDIGGGTANGSISASSALALGGGTLSLTRTGGVTQTFNGLTINAGASTINNTVSGDTLALGAITRTASQYGVVAFGTTSGNVTTSFTNVNSIIGPWAFFGTGANTKYAVANGGSAITGLTGTAAATGSDLIDTTGAANYDLAAGGGTVPATVSLNTIRYTGGADSLAPGTSFTVGGILNAGTGLWTIGTNTITIGSTKELVVNTANADITISSIIANNGAGNSVLTKTGAGTLTLSGANTYNAGTTVNAGTLIIAAAPGVNQGTMTINGGTLKLGIAGAYGSNSPQLTVNNGGTFDLNGITATNSIGTLQLAVGGTVTNNSSTAATLKIGAGNLNSTTVAGVIADGAGVVSISKTGIGAVTISGANTYTGTTAFGGTLSVSSLNFVTTGTWGTHASSNLGAPATTANGTIAIGSTTTAGVLTYTGAGETTDRVINLAGTTGGVTIDQSGTGLLKFTSAFTATGAGIKTLTLNGSTAGTGEIGGAIVNSPSATSLTKAGTGTWTLSGTSTYTGTTTISAGTCVVSVDKGLGNTASLVVNGGILDLRGATAGTVTLGAGAAFSLTAGTIVLDLGTAFDQIVSSGAGTFTISGGTFALNVTGPGFNYGNSYQVLSGFGGANSVSNLSFTGYDTASYQAILSAAGALSFNAVPEPGTWVLVGIGLSFMLYRKRRPGSGSH